MQWVVLGRVRKEALSDGVSGRICVMRSASEEGKRAGKTSHQDVQKALGLGVTGGRQLVV